MPDLLLLTSINDIFAAQIGANGFTLPAVLVMIGTSLLLGLLNALVYIRSQKKVGGDTTLSLTLIMIPAIITMIIVLIGNNVARAFTLAGSLAIIRYRSNPASPKDIACVFLSLAIGLGCGIGYVAYAVLFTLIMLAVILVISATGFGIPKSRDMRLRILIPENLNFEGAFDDILDEYASFYRLSKVRTSDFGTLFELVFVIKLKPDADKKAFLDKIRARNGNLNITLTLGADVSEG